MQSTHTYPSASRASPYASFSSRKRRAVYTNKVATEMPIICRPGWTPDYELIASRIPTLILPSYAIPCSVPLERSNVQSKRTHSPIPMTPTIIVTPPGARLGGQKTRGRSNENLFSGSMSEFYSDLNSPESIEGQGIQTPMSVPLSRSTSNRHSSSSKRQTSSKSQATRSRSSRGSSSQYLQVPSPRHHRPSRRHRRSAQVKPLDRLNDGFTLVSSGVVERGDGRSPLWMHTDKSPRCVTPMLERMVLDN